MRCLFLQNPKNDLDSKKQPPYFMSKVMAVISVSYTHLTLPTKA